MRRSGAEKANWRRTAFDLERAANQKALDITLHTRVPSKWLVVDLETGEVYRGQQRDGRGILVRAELPNVLPLGSNQVVKGAECRPMAARRPPKVDPRVKDGIRRPKAKAKAGGANGANRSRRR